MQVTLTGPWAGVVVVGLGLILLFAPAKLLYRGNRLTAQRAHEPPTPRWAVIFYRVLGVLLVALGAALLWRP